MGTARVAQLGVAAALLLSLLAAPAAPLPVARSSSPPPPPPSRASSSRASSEPCVPAGLHGVISGNIRLLMFRALKVLQAYKEMADVEISEHGAVLSALEPCVRRAEAAPTPRHLSGAFALYGALVAALAERSQLPRDSPLRTDCRTVVSLLEDTPFRLARGDAGEAGDAAAGRRRQAVGTAATARGGADSADDSAAVATEATRVANRTEAAAARAAGATAAAAASTVAPTQTDLRGEQNTQAGLADAGNVTVTAEKEDKPRQRINHHHQYHHQQQQQVNAEREKEVGEAADERSQLRLLCSPSHVTNATSLHGSSDSRVVMFALFERFQKFLTEVSRHLKPCQRP